jgi:hypothetical protein
MGYFVGCYECDEYFDLYRSEYMDVFNNGGDDDRTEFLYQAW